LSLSSVSSIFFLGSSEGTAIAEAVGAGIAMMVVNGEVRVRLNAAEGPRASSSNLTDANGLCKRTSAALYVSSNILTNGKLRLTYFVPLQDSIPDDWALPVHHSKQGPDF
jgi:hypothetical protein